MKKTAISRFKTYPLSTQMNITIGLIILVTVCLLTGFTYYNTLNQTKQNFKNNGLLILQETMDKINSRLKLVENTVEMIANDSRILNYGNELITTNSDVEVLRYLNSCYDFNRFDLHQEGLSYVKNLIDDILLITDDNYLIVRKLHFSTYNIKSHLQSEWFQMAYHNKGKSMWTDHFLNSPSKSLFNSNNKQDIPLLNNFMLIRYVVDEKRQRDVGWIAISMNLENLSQVIENIQFGKEGKLYIIDKQGAILASQDRSRILSKLELDNGQIDKIFKSNANENFFEAKSDQVKQFIYHAPLAINGWRLVLSLPVSAIEESFYNTVASVVLIALAAFIIITLISTIILNSITDPLDKMLYAIQETRKGDLSRKVDVKGCMEVNQLSTEFNFMLDTIQELLTKVMEEQKALRKSELKTLRAQINPHFLYNTLDSIKWLIYSKDDKKASELISSLSTFFRIGLSGGSEEIKIGDEVEHARQYLFIQKMRTGDKMNYVIDMDRDIENMMTPKLILQPIIENAIIHGLNKKDGDGIIKLLIKKTEDSILFEITDNGIGMEPSKVECLSRQIDEPAGECYPKTHGFAVWNVNQRIKLSYGIKYGVAINSKFGVGTKVGITIPVIERCALSA